MMNQKEADIWVRRISAMTIRYEVQGNSWRFFENGEGVEFSTEDKARIKKSIKKLLKNLDK